MQILQFAAETPPDPTWLRLLATVFPVVGTIVVAFLTGPKILEKHRERRDARANGDPVPAPVAANAVTASTDPIVRLFIEDLHERLSAAHEDAARLHQLRAVDAGTIARLSGELNDKEQRLSTIERELATKTTQNRVLRSQLEDIGRELEATRKQLAICIEGYQT